MAFTSSKSLVLFLALNLLFFAFSSACGECGSGNPKPSPKPSKPHPGPGGYPGSGGSPSTPGGGSPSTPGGGSPSTPGGGSPSTPGGGGSPSTPGGGGSSGACPIDALKLGVCANVLGGLLNLNIGTPPRTPCCPLIQGLIDAEAALCLCTVIRANILGINLNIPLSLSLLVNYCGRSLPRGFQCPN